MMKKFYIILFCLFSFSSVTSQKIYKVEEVDRAPLLKGCEQKENSKDCFKSGITNHILKNLDQRKIKDINDGTAYAQFVIGEDARIKDLRVNSNSEHLKRETTLLIEKLQFLAPAIKNERKVAVQYMIPVKFVRAEAASYDDYFAAENGGNKVLEIEKVHSKPTIKNCSNIPCLNELIIDKTLIQLKEKGYTDKALQEVRFIFLIDEQAQINNLFIRTLPETLQEDIRSILTAITFDAPAKDEKGNPVTVQFSYNWD